MRPGSASARALVAGVMSGTSADGIDVALLRIEGHGPGIDWSLVGGASVPFPEELRDLVMACASADRFAVDDLARLHVRLALAYASAVREALEACGCGPEDLDLVGCHGQTVRHLPEPRIVAGVPVTATLQLGSGPAMAARLGVPVVTDFRAADMALGGQGAPLVPYVDWLLLGHPSENRVALNLGGIANVTVLPAGCGRDQVTAFDTGPGNMVIDALCATYFARPFDADGAIAASAAPDGALLDRLAADPWFAEAPPKSTGRERFGAAYAARLAGPDPAVLVATATALTARTVAAAIRRFAPVSVDRVLVGGGGARNPELMRRLAEAVAPSVVQTTDAAGVDGRYKEAIAFALLAHEARAGVATGMPSVTGAARRAVQGSLSLPPA